VSIGEGKCCSDFGKRVCQFNTRESSMTGDPLKAWAAREEKESERTQISQKNFGWRNAKSVKRRIRADWKWHVWDGWHHSRPYTSARDSAEKLERLGHFSRTEKRRISIFCRPCKRLHLRHPKEKGQPSVHMITSDAGRLLRKEQPLMKVVTVKFGGSPGWGGGS